MLVQFGNNWMRKIPRTAKLDEAVCCPITYTNTPYDTAVYFLLGLSHCTWIKASHKRG